MEGLVHRVQVELLTVALGKLSRVVGQVVLFGELLLWITRLEHDVADNPVIVLDRQQILLLPLQVALDDDLPRDELGDDLLVNSRACSHVCVAAK